LATQFAELALTPDVGGQGWTPMVGLAVLWTRQRRRVPWTSLIASSGRVYVGNGNWHGDKG
jgi:MYXO-CTERM domain-containing protein